MLPFFKDFSLWLTLKPKLDQLISYPKFQEGDIWWCHIGANIGHEECGKGNNFLRPIMIKGKQVSVLMSQMRLFDVKRLYYKQGKVGDVELLKLKKDFVKLLLK